MTCTIAIAALAAVLAAPARAQSLWARNGADGRIHSLYRPRLKPRKPITVNDIILIVVDERSRARNDTNTDLRRQVEVDTELRDFIRFADNFHTLAPAALDRPTVDLDSERRQRSRGKTDRRDDMSFRIAARVVDALPNGNLVIAAEKHKKINDEESILTLTGEIRRQDIGLGRSIRSELIADLKLTYSGKGPVSRNQGRSIWTWLLDLIWF